MITLYHATFNAYKDSILTEGIRLPEYNKSNFGMYIGPYIFLADDDEIAISFIEDVDEDFVSEEIYDSGVCCFRVELPDDFDLFLDENNQTNWEQLDIMQKQFTASPEMKKYLQEELNYSLEISDLEELPLGIFLQLAKHFDVIGFTFMTGSAISKECLSLLD